MTGNVTAMVDQNGNLAAKYLYEPFGKVLAASGPLAQKNRLQFSGKEHDASSGLSYYGYRFYDPGLARWINEDPGWFVDGPNLYKAFGNSPANAFDPFGNEVVGSPEGTPFVKASSRRPDNQRRFFNLSLWDDRGRELLELWLRGKQTNVFRENGAWGRYMMSNDSLSAQVAKRLSQDAITRMNSGPVNITFHPEIENGYFTGYELLHGPNRLEGDFQIQGNATVTLNPAQVNAA